MKENQVVFVMSVDEEGSRYAVRLPFSADALPDNTSIVIDPALAAVQGIELDHNGFPAIASLDAWHRKNNPHLFQDGE